MNRRLSLLAALILVMAASSTHAQSFTEDFTTTTYKDEIVTTAEWDTAAGELRLPSFAPSLVGEFNTAGSAVGVAVDGDLAFVADLSGGLKILDISDLSAPALVGTYDTPGLASGVDAAGDLVFVADGLNGLLVIDVSNPASPALRGSYDTPGSAIGVDVAGNGVYVADGAAGLQVIDVTNPAIPTFVGSYDTPGTARGVVAAGNLAYVADQAGGLQILDISNPANPTFVGSHVSPSGARGVALDGGWAYIAGLNDGLVVVDVSNPAAPTLIGSIVTPGQALGVAVSGGRAFVADGNSGLQIIDITNPFNLSVVGGFDTSGQGSAVVSAGGHAFVADGVRGLQIIETAKFTDPYLAKSFVDPFYDVQHVAVARNLAFVADASQSRVAILALFSSSPFLGTIQTAQPPNHIEIYGDLAFVSTNNEVKIVGITWGGLVGLTGIGSFPTSGAQGIAVEGDIVYVASGSAGLLALDVTDPTNPSLAGSFNTLGIAFDVEVAGDYAFVADAGNGLLVFDVSNPALPVLVGSYDTAGLAQSVAVSGNHAYVADSSGGLVVLDVADVVNPTLVSTYGTPDSAEHVSVDGDIAAVSVEQSFNRRTLLLDISDPSAITELGNYGHSRSEMAELDGQHLYIADGSFGIKLVQVLQDEVAVTPGIGRSLTVNEGSETIVRARLTSTQTTILGLDWMLSAGGGVYEPTTRSSWLGFATPGSSLSWSSSTTWSPGLNPTVSELNLEWLFDVGPIVSIDDVPNDQGGRVYLRQRRSGYDFAEELNTPVTQYGVYRRVDDLPKAVLRSSGSGDSLPGEETVFVEDALYVLAGKNSSFPPGTWALINTVPATQSDEYLVEITTTADSTSSGTNESVFVVTTHTTVPSVWFVSEPDSGYSVDNIAPGVPSSIIATYEASGVDLDWNDAPENDFQFYRIYRGTEPDFVPSPGSLLLESSASSFTDPSPAPWGFYYKISAVDDAGNEGLVGAPSTVTGVGDEATRPRFALHDAVPNPFNPQTTLSFSLPVAGRVRLSVYDLTGRLVTTLVDEDLVRGRHDVDWDGTDRARRGVASGVYLYRIDTGTFSQTKRVVLLK